MTRPFHQILTVLPTRPARLILPALIFCGSLHAPGQQPGTAAATPAVHRQHSLSLSAQSVANGGAAKVLNNYQGTVSNGGLDKTDSMKDKRVANSQLNIRYSVRNYDAAPDSATLEWYFVASPVKTSEANLEFIFDHGSQALTIVGGKEATQTITSKEIMAIYERSTKIRTATDATYTSLSASQSGATSKGWMMRLVVDGQVLATQGSAQHYDDLAKDDAKLKAFLLRQPPASAVQ